MKIDRRLRLVQFSTGMSSAEVAFREVATVGAENVVLLTADTRVEDEDNWRFAIEVVERLPGVQWLILCDGRTPMQVGRDHRVVPNNRMAVCSRVLKRELIRTYIDEHYDPTRCIVDLGYDASEDGRWHDAHARVTCVPCRKAKPKTCPDHKRIPCTYIDAHGNGCTFLVSEANENPWEPWLLARPLADPPRIWDRGRLLDLFHDRQIPPPSFTASVRHTPTAGGPAFVAARPNGNGYSRGIEFVISSGRPRKN